MLSVPGATRRASSPPTAETAAGRAPCATASTPTPPATRIAAEVGTVDDNNIFTSGGATPNAVRVVVGSTMDYLFAPAART